MIKVIDNFLPKEDFIKIKDLLLSTTFPWYHQKSKVGEDNDMQFTHVMYEANPKWEDVEARRMTDSIWQKGFYSSIDSLLRKMEINALVRMKANITFKESTIRPFTMHTDVDYCNLTTAVYYINTTNGKTLFENGDEVLGVENRLVAFPAYMMHTGTSHTDEQMRIVLNINYF